MKRNLILDVDTGSDDAFAILLAARSETVNLLGITVTQGNRSLENCVQNTLQVLELLRVEAPVYPGCPAPMVRELSPGRSANNPGGPTSVVVDGVEYCIHPARFDLPEPTHRAMRQHACSFLLETCRKSDGPVTIVTTAPPTNVGMAFRMEPKLAESVDEVVFMGGAVGRGNVTPVAEANFFHDPEAAKIIFDSGVRTKVLTLSATHSAELTLEDARRLVALGNPVGAFYGKLILSRCAAGYRLGWGTGTSEAVHDGLAVAALLDPRVVTKWKRCRCDVDIAGGAGDGQLICHADGDKDAVALEADKQRYFDLICAAAEA